MKVTIAFKSSVVDNRPLSTASFYINIGIASDRAEIENVTPKNMHAVLFAIARKRLAKGYPRAAVFPVAFDISAEEHEYIVQNAKARAA